MTLLEKIQVEENHT